MQVLPPVSGGGTRTIMGCRSRMNAKDEERDELTRRDKPRRPFLPISTNLETLTDYRLTDYDLEILFRLDLQRLAQKSGL